MSFQTLENQEFKTLHKAFAEAFSDYMIQISTIAPHFSKRLHRIGFTSNCSAANFDNQQINAFIIHAVADWQGKKTLYNGGTGVIPSHRGQKLIPQIYQFLENIISEQKIEQSLLEVIKGNDRAKKMYENVGFQTVRELNCYLANSKKVAEIKCKLPIQLQISEKAQWKLYQTFGQNQICWQNSEAALKRNFAHETVIEAYHKAECIGYLFVEQSNGNVSQMAVREEYQRNGVASQLIRAAARISAYKLSLINVPIEPKIHHFLVKHNFNSFLTQYEMLLNF